MRSPTLLWFFAWPYCAACGDARLEREHARAVDVTISAGRAGGGSGQGGSGPGGAGQGGAGNAAAPPELTRCSFALPYTYQTGRGYWLGGDGTSSVALSESRALVAFQESFVGGPSKLSRVDSELSGSSVARLSCLSGKLSVEYAWGGAGHEHAALFDDDASDGVELRLQQPWLTAGKLFFTATRVTRDDSGVTEHGTTLIRVDDPLAPIAEWQVEYFELTAQRASVGAGVAETSSDVFLFTTRGDELGLTRITKERLLAPTVSEGSLETLRADGTWGPGLELDLSRRLGLPARAGLSVRHHAPSGRWLALFTNTSVLPSASISVSSALDLAGPWSTPTLVYTVPEMSTLSPEYRSGWVCSGAREHPAFNALVDKELLFSYSCRPTNRASLLVEMSAFQPRVVRLGLPLSF